MFVYENGNSLNLTFKGSLPVENPEVVIKGYKDGATLTVNGTVYGSGSEEFENKANLLVYQKDNKLAVTFRGVVGMSDPEVTLDEVSEDVIDAVVNGRAVKLTFTESGVLVNTNDEVIEEPADDPVPEEPVADETDPEVISEDEDEPEEVVGE